MTRINNVRIKDLLGLLHNLSKHYDAVDIVVDTTNRRVILDPVVGKVSNPNSDVILTDQNIEDLI